MGPALVAVFRPLVGVHGLVWIFATLCAASTLMTHVLKSPADPQYRVDAAPAEVLPEAQAIEAAQAAAQAIKAAAVS
ncbi:hypothetical protein Sipo8835_18245 [Streptomyces ipomoeae]|uniref:Uncharacterized protein n=2 Tax=Streptomyces ipomoeae TaxID=103232 RepID=L1KXN9_9ACTN|nr:hypothetical protein [Streptomyces ipomoeae]EKX65255.1 hypothetical protein STRIP9103_09233 [Streptomyces ipomoeae 91-03]TQE20916.1 hypothetical protein Sipo7851_41525 [Streptomyces ipomoeae]TQE33282.1 hypothetical protein Sipo8835_18245 [Streptomyces ipomoeae]